MTNAERFIELERIYARLPRVACKGLCHDSCAIVPVFPMERLRMEARSGVRYTLARDGHCGYLTPEKRCAVYAVRPYICRVYAATRDPLLRCPHGCQAERPLSEEDTVALHRRMGELLGEPEFPDIPWMKDPVISIGPDRMVRVDGKVAKGEFPGRVLRVGYPDT